MLLELSFHFDGRDHVARAVEGVDAGVPEDRCAELGVDLVRARLVLRVVVEDVGDPGRGVDRVVDVGDLVDLAVRVVGDGAVVAVDGGEEAVRVGQGMGLEFDCKIGEGG